MMIKELVSRNFFIVGLLIISALLPLMVLITGWDNKQRTDDFHPSSENLQPDPLWLLPAEENVPSSFIIKLPISIQGWEQVFSAALLILVALYLFCHFVVLSQPVSKKQQFKGQGSC